jgi:hypothetical protein
MKSSALWEKDNSGIVKNTTNDLNVLILLLLFIILLAYNGFQICDVADLEALNFQFTTNVY